MSKQNAEEQLIQDIAAFSHDPLGFVLYAFDWGKGELLKFDGPDSWQVDILNTLGERLRKGELTVTEAVQIAVASGHGIGKSALVSWIILWAVSTHEDTKGVVTANTENQLKTKTWAELAKWYRLCITRHWFHHTATALFSVDPEHEKTWRIDMVPWSERNTEAFAGLHNQGKRILIVFDEASAIHNLIWEVTEGALTDEDTEIIWCCFGNPTQNIGRFRECFSKFAHRWVTRNIDSRTAKMTNKRQLQKWVDDYGEDSDFVRVRVRGLFPNASANALIGPDDIKRSMERHYTEDQVAYAPVILGVDVAREGDDQSAIARRKGNIAFPIKTMRIPDTTLVAEQVKQVWGKHDADACFVDMTGGFGAGVVDMLRLSSYDPMGVHFASASTDPQYFNKRSEMYMKAAKWIKETGQMPDDQELADELMAHTYAFVKDKFRICEKDEVKATLGRSPDKADAFVLTFAFDVAPKTAQQRLGLPSQPKRQEYNPYANM